MAGRAHGLQKSGLPRTYETSQDPDAPLGRANYVRANLYGNEGAVPSEAYQYDIAFKAFVDDEFFKKQWRVVAACRTPPGVSISRDHAMIRVVMDLHPGEKLYPTAYTPGRPILRIDSDEPPPGADQMKEIPGLPPGYSIALDVYILETARIRLRHQREFRGGKVDPDAEWLDAIIREHDNEEQGKEDATKPKPRVKKLARPHLRAETDEPAITNGTGMPSDALVQHELFMKDFPRPPSCGAAYGHASMKANDGASRLEHKLVGMQGQLPSTDGLISRLELGNTEDTERWRLLEQRLERVAPETAATDLEDYMKKLVLPTDL